MALFVDNALHLKRGVGKFWLINIKTPEGQSAVAIKKYLTITALYVPPLKEYNNILTKVRQKKE